MLRKLFGAKKAETYIDTAIGVIIVIMFIVFALSIFQMTTLKVNMDRIADDLLEVATYTGEFGEEFDERVTLLRERYFHFDVKVGADPWYNETLMRVQLGDNMRVTIIVNATLDGFGVPFPMELTLVREGQSEQYWKT